MLFGVPEDFSIVVTYNGEIITGRVCNYSISQNYNTQSFTTIDINCTLYPETEKRQGGIIVPKTIQQASTDVLLNESLNRIRERFNK